MEQTVGAIVISYDVNRMHNEIKDGLKNLGYSDNWRYKGPTYFMPNTTLWHKSKTSDAAIEDLKSVCRRLSVTLEKAVAVLASEFVGI